MPKSRLKYNSFILYTLGDPAGIGPEILTKALNKKLCDAIAHLVVGDLNVIKRYVSSHKLKFKVHTNFEHLELSPGVINVLNVDSDVKIHPGKPDEITGKLSYRYLKLGIEVIRKYPHRVKSLITLPVSKFHIRLAGYAFNGHTEFLQREFRVPRVEMIFLTPDFDVLLLTRHIPVKEVSKRIKKEDLVSRIIFVTDAYRRRFKLSPRIAVLGLNPHAGEGGFIGKEEEDILKPAIEKLRKNKLHIQGPFPADGFFRNYKQLKFHLIISCYHDQVLPLIKAIYPQSVNFTLGLPFLRFSPNHGPAFDIAGKDKADPSSLIQCIKYALKLNAG